MTRQALICY